MDDLISRRAAIDLFPDDDLEYDTKGGYVAPHLARQMICELPSAQPESKWIPVSERLPDEGQKCLVSDKGAIGIDTYIGHGNPYNWKWYVKDYEAWMPLPEPYRGGDSNE